RRMERLRPLGDAREDLWPPAPWRKQGVLRPVRTRRFRFFLSADWRELWCQLQNVAALYSRIHQHVFDERWHLTSRLRDRRDGQSLLRTCERDIKQPTLFLVVKRFLRLSLFHQPCRKLEYARPLPRRELALIDAENENVRKLEPLGTVDAHELYGVAGSILFQRNRATSLIEVFRILDEFRPPTGVVFRLPRFQEFRQAVDIGAILPGTALVPFEPLKNAGKNLRGGAFVHPLALRGEKFEQLAQA